MAENGMGNGTADYIIAAVSRNQEWDRAPGQLHRKKPILCIKHARKIREDGESPCPSASALPYT
jgi:hypothetical protein